MRRAGIAGCHRRWRRIRTTQRDLTATPAPDLVQRAFTPQAPNELWVSDITYVPTRQGFLFLAVILDVFSRRVVGWSMAEHLRAELVLAALGMAALGMAALGMAAGKRHPQAGLIHHSDHGCQYTSVAFSEHGHALGIRCSMGTIGDCYANAMAESFFATLACELLQRQTFRTHDEARSALFEFIRELLQSAAAAFRSGLSFSGSVREEVGSYYTGCRLVLLCLPKRGNFILAMACMFAH